MGLTNYHRRSTTLLLGFACTILGFSWALATSAPAHSRAAAVSARSVGSQLRISNPFLLPGQDAQFPSGGDPSADPDGFDLGDATLGSQLVRYISGLGGVRPYRFAFAPVGSASGTGLSLESSGRVVGAATAAGPNSLSFGALLTDASGGTRSGVFRLGLETSQSFRFAIDRLPSAQIGQDYFTKVEVLGGDASTTLFSVVASSISINGVAVNDLESQGLTLFEDGTLAGRPLNSGRLVFTARATRGSARALNRGGTAEDQVLSGDVAAVGGIQSQLATVKAMLRGGKPSKDVLDLQVLINAAGRMPADFANKTLELRFAGKTFQTTLDASGQSRSGNLRSSLSSSGSLRLQLRNQDFRGLFGATALPDRSTQTATLAIRIGESFIATEPIFFHVKSRRGAFQLSYRLGKDRQLSGLFQIVSVKTSDSAEGTAYQAKFMLAHIRGYSELLFDQAQQATVKIGSNFTQTVSLSRGRGKFFGGGIANLKIDTKRKVGTLTTTRLTEAQTGFKSAAAATGQTQVFLMNLKLSTPTLDFEGDASRRTGR
jgi:hypothetical protein